MRWECSLKKISRYARNDNIEILDRFGEDFSAK